MPGKLTLTIGLPGSGKSTWAYAQPLALVVERDEIREELTGDRRDHTREVEVSHIARMRVIAGLRLGFHVIVSDTNLKGRYRRQWERIAREVGAPYEEVSFLHVPVETCIARDAERPNPVGRDVIERMASSLS